MQALDLRAAVALALLLCSLAAGQASQCAPVGSTQLRFVAQLNVNGCALFVHDTGASDDPQLAIEPIMCVTDGLRGLLPVFDLVTERWYVSVPVLFKDPGMLAEAQHEMQNVSSKPVTFTSVTDLSVSSDPNSFTEAIGLVWSPHEPVASVRLALKLLNRSTTDDVAKASVSSIAITATLRSNGSCFQMLYRPSLNLSFINADAAVSRYSAPACHQLRFVRYVDLENCTARVHQRLDIDGHFVIEPLLCFNISSMSNELFSYDFSRDKHYLKLDLVLQDDASLDAVRTQLADLSPRSVEFMRLWRAERIVSSLLSTRYEIGPLMVSADWRSAQLRLFCGNIKNCRLVRFAILSNPADLWRHIKWHVTSMMGEKCIVKSDQVHFSCRMPERSEPSPCVKRLSQLLSVQLSQQRASVKKFIHELPDGRCFVKIQQRVTGDVSFQRSWREYETGFGDETDFWIGLSAIHSLSAGGATLRLEMKPWNGAELHAEYAGFRVGDARSKYVMTYEQMLRDKSSVGIDAMNRSKGARFSTRDSDNDGYYGSCSKAWGNVGWWFNIFAHLNPNGLFPSEEIFSARYMFWFGGRTMLILRQVRLLLEV